MIRYYKLGETYYWADEQTKIAEGSIEVTQQEFELAINPTPTLEQQFEAVRQALQSAIDVKAQEFEFSNGNSLMLYAGFVNPFQSLAQQFATWEASVWVEAGQYKAQVIAGTQPMLTPEQAVAMMPEYP